MKSKIIGYICLFLTLPCLNYLQASESGYKEIEDQNQLEIKTPSLQNRSIAKVQLANGLKALLISDPETDKSAAALAVNVGSWSDPMEYPGMAHFLEHMLFMGTKAYPDENGYFQYIFDHGGLANAYTLPDRTVYMFSVNNDSFPETLDRFSHFFIDPLFKQSGVERELLAVDQEHSKNIENDYRRVWEIFKETGNENHPNHAFATGNAQTLSGIPRSALVSWYQSHYSASIMNLVVYSSKPMDELKKLVLDDFSKIKGNFSPPTPEFKELTSAKQKGHIVYVKPVKDLKYLTLDFELPKDIAKEQDSKSVEFVCYLLQNGSENSLKETLKRQQLIEDMGCDIFDVSTENKLIKVSFSLTKEGVSKVDEVIQTAFQAIHGLTINPIPAYLFNEMQIMAKLNYKFQSRENAFSFVSEKAHQLIDEDLNTFPQKTLTATKYKPELVQKILSQMTPENCIYFIIAPPNLTGIDPEKTEKNSGGEYSIRKISENYLDKWANIPASSQIALPKPNPYIPTDLKLLYKTKEKEHVAVPTLVTSNEFGQYYFWGDDRYKIPEIDYKLSFKTPEITGSSKSQVLLDLYLRAFSQKLAPELSLAGEAGLYAMLSYDNLKLNLHLTGYSEKAAQLLEDLLPKMNKLTISNSEFETYKDSLLSSYQNVSKSMPFMQCAAYVSNILYNDAPLAKDKAIAIKQITYDEFVSFTEKLYTKCFVEGLLAGNLSKDEAIKITKLAPESLKFSQFPLEDRPEKQLLILPSQGGPYMVEKPITAMGNAAILVVEQGPSTLENKAAQLVLSKALQESFFTTLRSKQQTGYIAKSFAKEVEHQLLQYFLVQSNTHQPDDLISRFELFIESYIKDFSSEISEERFEMIRKSLIEDLKQPPTNLQEMTSHLYRLAFYRSANFYYEQELIGALSDITYDKLKAHTKKFFSRQNPKRLAVVVEGKLPTDQLFKYQMVSSESLKEMGTYISSEL